MKAPLEGIRVIDWTIWQQGPYSTAILADFGAEVIKIEEREKGDPGRGIASLGGASGSHKGRNFYLESNNRHKKSVALDLKKPEAREVVYKLAEKSDVFVQNFRQGVAARMGLDYQTLRRYNPRLIYGSASGYGPHGPDSAEPSFDYLGQARSGIMYTSCVPNKLLPAYITGGIADQMGAIVLAFGIMTAIVARERFGVGQEVDASHLGSMIALQGLNISARTIIGKSMASNTREVSFNPLWNHYKCKDGKWICLAMIQGDRYWKDFCKVLGVEHMITDPRFAEMRERGHNATAAIELLDAAFATRPREEWMKLLHEGGDFIFTIVNHIDDLEDDPQVLANDYIVDYEHPGFGKMKLVGVAFRLGETPGQPRGRAPEHGEHTETILTELLGYSWEDIDNLRQKAVI